MSKIQRRTTGELVKIILEGVWNVSTGIIRLLLRLFFVTGIWIPTAYALLGVVLYYGFNIQILDFEAYSIIYLCGACACVVGFMFIFVKNMIIQPVKNYKERKKRRKEMVDKPGYSGIKDETDQKVDPIEQEEFKVATDVSEVVKPEPRLQVPDATDEDIIKKLIANDLKRYEDSLSTKKKEQEKAEQEESMFNQIKVEPIERPQVYFSSLQENLLVHEYSDRYELFIVTNGKPRFKGVEYK